MNAYKTTKGLLTEPDGLANITEVLEAVTDRLMLGQVLDELSLVCSLKADHLRESWQDYASAKEWDNAAKRLQTARKGLRI